MYVLVLETGAKETHCPSLSLQPECPEFHAYPYANMTMIKKRMKIGHERNPQLSNQIFC